MILTGGTIDSFYYPPDETAQPSEASVIPDYVSKKIKPHANISYETICMLDSNNITDEIRDKIIASIKGAKAQGVIITHGTNTMTQTAQYLAENLPQTDKTIILTGAMIPLKEFAMSDAGFNLGYAIAQVQNAQSGIYIAMNAHLFKTGEVIKNIDIGRFEGKG